jgi:hypothetical protein
MIESVGLARRAAPAHERCSCQGSLLIVRAPRALLFESFVAELGRSVTTQLNS